MEPDVSQANRFYEFLGWVEVNKKRVLIAAAIISLLILAFAIYQWKTHEQEAAASKSLLELSAGPSRGQNAKSPPADAFLKLSGRYPGTAAGERALLIGAGALFTAGKYAEALTQFERFVKEYRGSLWLPQALFGIAACADAANRTDEAIAKYQEIVSRYASDTVGDQAKLALAHLYEAKNQPKLALNQYDELVRGKTQSSWSFAAREERSRLLEKHPELAVTNAPPTMVTTNVPALRATNLPAKTNVTLPLSNQPGPATNKSSP